MDDYAGIDVSLEQSGVCVVDATGKMVCEAKVASEPEAAVRFFGQLSVPVTRIGLEASPLSQWLHAGLSGSSASSCRASCAMWSSASAAFCAASG
jgi:hypothetical protein